MKNSILTGCIFFAFVCSINAQKSINAYKVGKQTSKLFYSQGVVLLLDNELQYKCLGSKKELKDESFDYTNIVSVERKIIPFVVYSVVVIKTNNGESKRFKVAKPILFVSDLKSRIAR